MWPVPGAAMSDSTMSARPSRSSALSAPRRARIHEIELQELDARRSAPSARRSMATTWPLPSTDCTRSAATWRPAAGRGAEIDDARAGLQQAVLVVDLDQLVGRARAIALALGGGHVGIVELPLEPALRGGRCAACAVFSRTLQLPLPAGPAPRCLPLATLRAMSLLYAGRRPAALAAVDAVLGHQRRQDAFAQAAVGDAQALARPRPQQASRMAQPASTRSARSRPMHGSATRCS